MKREIPSVPAREATHMSAKVKKARTLSLAEAADALGVPAAFVLTLTLTGARRPADQGGTVVELDYDVNDGEVTFTKTGIARFLKQCPVGELVPSIAVEKRLGVERGRVAVLVYTGIPAAGGKVRRLPVWVIGGREYVLRADLEEYAEHFKRWAEEKAAREFRKRYERPGKKPAPAA